MLVVYLTRRITFLYHLKILLEVPELQREGQEGVYASKNNLLVIHARYENNLQWLTRTTKKWTHCPQYPLLKLSRALSKPKVIRWKIYSEFRKLFTSFRTWGSKSSTAGLIAQELKRNDNKCMNVAVYSGDLIHLNYDQTLLSNRSLQKSQR